MSSQSYPSSTSVKRRRKQYIVIVLKLVLLLALQLPVSVVDEHKNARSPATKLAVNHVASTSKHNLHKPVLQKQLFSGSIHMVLLQEVEQINNCER